MKLMDLAYEVQRRANDVQIIRRQGNKVLVRVADGSGGRLRLVGREWLEGYLDELDAAERLARSRGRNRS
jgi:hypothetical protein